MYISLRPWIIDDVAALTGYYNNVNIWNNLRNYIPHPYSNADAEKFIQTQIEIFPTLNFAVLNEGTIVGGIGITLLDDVYAMNVEPVSYTHLTLPTKRIV